MQDGDALRAQLANLDGRSYRAYREIQGAYRFDRCTVYIDHVQGDPFAAPSKVRIRVASSENQIPPTLFDNRVRRLACEDFIARRVRLQIEVMRVMKRGPLRDDKGRRGRGQQRRGSGSSGVISIDAGGQQVLERTAVVANDDWVEARLSVGLPATGRRILGAAARDLLCDTLPQIADAHLTQLPLEEASHFVDCVENQEDLRDRLESLGLIAFIADGAVLPRESGASHLPLRDAVRFESPPSLRVELPLLHPIEIDGTRHTTLTGLGIRRGVTLIVGGGYHGKSTLLRAIERGVYPHIPGDGREWVVADRALVKIRAEDGRHVAQVDIHGFIDGLPDGRSTHRFDSEDASGSTSQAANIMESIEVGATGLLLDEDTSATNFMIRDARMAALIHRDDEPITPFVERVRALYERLGISSVLVMGGCGDYFEPADHVISMRDFLPRDVTEEAKRIAAESPRDFSASTREPLEHPAPRIPIAASFDASRGRHDVKIAARGVDRIAFGHQSIELREVEQLVDESQTRAIGNAIALAARDFMDDTRSLTQVLDELERLFDERGLDPLDPFHDASRGCHPGNFARPRRFEIAAAINRLRGVRMKSQGDGG